MEKKLRSKLEEELKEYRSGSQPKGSLSGDQNDLKEQLSQAGRKGKSLLFKCLQQEFFVKA